MKFQIFTLISGLLFVSILETDGQDVFSVSSGELLFQFSETEINNVDVKDQPRFTMFLHLGQYWHMNLGNNIGFYSGIALRNVGFIYDEDSPIQKTIRRSYTLGVPLALKLGSFKNHFYLFGGGEYELLFHYKGKRWLSNDREGPKIKDTEWFSDKTNRFVPSAFVGIQFPGGIRVAFKYYLSDFLNRDYVGRDLGVNNVSFSDYTRQELFYLSVSWQLRTDEIREKLQGDDKIADLR